MEATLTTCPPLPRWTMRGTNRWQPWTTPFKLIPTIQSQSSSGVCRKSAPRATPALLTRMSTASLSACTASASLAMS